MGYSPWGGKEWDMTERLHFHFRVLNEFGRKWLSYKHHFQEILDGGSAFPERPIGGIAHVGAFCV